MIQIRYNEPDDEFDYPIRDWHRQVIADVSAKLRLPAETVWFQYATIHGRIFGFDRRPDQGGGRLDREFMEFFMGLPGFRWVETGKFRVALEHDLV